MMAQACSQAKSPKWRTLSYLFNRFGHLSEGISIGCRYGFDSGQMLDYVYQNHSHGRLQIGKLVDRIYLDAVGWRGIRARKEVLKMVLHELLREREQQERRTTVLDIASGPGRYLHEVCQTLNAQGRGDRLKIVCRDLDPVGLELGRHRAAALGLSNIRYEEGDACDPVDLSRVTPRPHVVVASGLYELLDPSLIRQSMSGVRQILPEGGHFIFTTQVNHPQLELIANLLVNRHGEPWVMQCRQLAEVEGWARDTGFTVIGSRMEEVGLFGVTLCVKV